MLCTSAARLVHSASLAGGPAVCRPGSSILRCSASTFKPPIDETQTGKQNEHVPSA